MKYSKIEGALSWSGGTVILRKGMSIDDDHPLVTERPDLWDATDPGAELSSGAPQVERATQAPGEIRTAQAKNRVRSVQ